ncbi:hypothetical protein OQH60_06265 [Campylobacter sp. MIT 21-1685]|uniref:hypothetical protein n=1 Tax=unclassified Campylobacter TaxID=2593542 RepID=UPI00224B9711|nr:MULTISPECIES: hypothetical protein [unclassified Campylobacter]MCX2683429.1 hypothetical protein [Campylobacter sp. MIT 21-1684]MCX2751750.1 hypothetical protein [Campylobacter sp. MIT 21-1682]MCX2807951.1 hypothetical protein [Campylobacter sp. MIT 21-1685]
MRLCRVLWCILTLGFMGHIDANVSIYPNELHRNMYLIGFFQDYKAFFNDKPSEK